MNSRSEKIIRKIVISDECENKIRELADFYDVSPRTIYKDIEEINIVLSKLNQKEIKLDGNGNVIVPSNLDKKLIETYLDEIDLYNYHLNSNERQSLLLAKLIESKEIIHINSLAEEFFVSRSTIYNDLNVTSNKINESNYSFSFELSNQPLGIISHGSENERRKILFDLIINEIKSPINLSSYQRLLLRQVKSYYSIENILNIVSFAEHENEIQIKDSDICKNTIFLYIAVNHYLRGDKLKQILNKADSLTIDFANNIFSKYQINDTNEINSYANFLKNTESTRELARKTDADVYTLVAKFLYGVSEDLNLNLFSDNTTFVNLVIHFESMIERARNDQQYDKKLMEANLLIHYSDVFHAVQKNIGIVQSYFNCVFNHDEVIFVVMYVCVIIEKIRSKGDQLKVVVVSPGSMASGQMLSIQLQSKLNLKIEDVTSKNLPSSEALNKCDFVVSTCKIEGITKPLVIIKPVLTHNDIDSILIQISRIRYLNLEGWNITTKNVISTRINKDLILIKKTDNWRDAITTGGNLLLKTKNIEKKYIDSMIENIENYGPYFAVAPGIVLAHANVNSGINKAGISLVYYRQGVLFGMEDCDPIKYVFCIAEKSSEAYMQIFNNAIMIAKNKKIEELISESETAIDLYNKIREIEL